MPLNTYTLDTVSGCGHKYAQDLNDVRPFVPLIQENVLIQYSILTSWRDLVWVRLADILSGQLFS